jgi:hypothetical protein
VRGRRAKIGAALVAGLLSKSLAPALAGVKFGPGCCSRRPAQAPDAVAFPWLATSLASKPVVTLRRCVAAGQPSAVASTRAQSRAHVQQKPTTSRLQRIFRAEDTMAAATNARGFWTAFTTRTPDKSKALLLERPRSQLASGFCFSTLQLRPLRRR